MENGHRLGSHELLFIRNNTRLHSADVRECQWCFGRMHFGDNCRMWLCFNDGFVSVVAHENRPDRLLVRARRKRDLLNVCGKDADVIKNGGSDYRWRTFIDRKAFASVLAGRIERIRYPNFKNSVKDNDLHDLYVEFWQLHRRYQDQSKAR
jgi:hypothetical protein